MRANARKTKKIPLISLGSQLYKRVIRFKHFSFKNTPDISENLHNPI